jgi:hypothetical protein
LSSGNFGIGTSSPNEKLQVNGAVLSTGALSAVRTSAASVDFLTGNTRFISMGADASTKGGFIWYNSTNAAVTEAMRIDSSGNLLVGTTTALTTTRFASHQSTAGAYCAAYKSTKDGSNNSFLNAFYNDASSLVGYIVCKQM